MQCLAWNLNSKKQETKPQALLAAEIKGNEIKFRNLVHMPAYQEDKATQKTHHRWATRPGPAPTSGLPPVYTTQRAESGRPSGPFTVLKHINELDSHRKDVTAVKRKIRNSETEEMPWLLSRAPADFSLEFPVNIFPQGEPYPFLERSPSSLRKHNKGKTRIQISDVEKAVMSHYLKQNK